MTVSISGTGGITFNDSSVQNTAATGFGFKNRIINSAMVIDQRNAGASVTPTVSVYTLDRWRAVCSVTSKFSVQRNAGAITPPVGFQNYLGVTSLAATSLGASDQYRIDHAIEGFNVSDLDFGTANATAVTLSFRVYSSLTGSFGALLCNGAFNRNYPFSFSIPVANTWTTITVTIAGDTTGTWAKDNSAGMYVSFSLGVGSSLVGTANAWTASSVLAPTGSVSVVGTNGATFYITGVQLEKGSTATSFDYRPYGTELVLCQRYAFKSVATAEGDFGSGACTGGGAQTTFSFPVIMRTAPTATFSAAANFVLADGLGGYSCTGISLINSTASQATTLGTAAGTTGGRGALLRWNTGTAFILLNSEL